MISGMIKRGLYKRIFGLTRESGCHVVSREGLIWSCIMPEEWQQESSSKDFVPAVLVPKNIKADFPEDRFVASKNDGTVSYGGKIKQDFAIKLNFEFKPIASFKIHFIRMPKTALICCVSSSLNDLLKDCTVEKKCGRNATIAKRDFEFVVMKFAVLLKGIIYCFLLGTRIRLIISPVHWPPHQSFVFDLDVRWVASLGDLSHNVLLSKQVHKSVPRDCTLG